MFRIVKTSLVVLFVATFCACFSNGPARIAGKPVSLGNIDQSDDPAFIFFGDFGTGSKHQFRIAQTMVEFCEQHRCDFLLTLGDNIYPDGISSLDDPRLETLIEVPYSPIGKKMYAVLGNHDYRGDPGLQVEYSALSEMWTLPSSYYDFRTKNALFMGIDTNAFDGEQQAWLHNRLSEDTDDWKIVFGHHPVVSYGRHGPKDEVAGFLLPILDSGADIYFAGHEHDNQLIDLGEDHPQYIISGTAAKLRPAAAGKGTLFASSALGFGYMVLHEDAAELSFINERGEVAYRTVIPK